MSTSTRFRGVAASVLYLLARPARVERSPQWGDGQFRIGAAGRNPGARTA